MSKFTSTATDFDIPANTLPQLVWKAQPGGPVEQVNRQMCEYFGHSAQKLKDLFWDELVHPDDVSRLRTRWHQCLETEDDVTMEIRLRSADGAYHWHRGQIIPRTDEEEQVVEWIGIYTPLENRLFDPQPQSQNGSSWTLPAGVEGSLQETLKTLTQLIENQCPGILASILLTGEDGRRLHHGAAPSLPNAYNRAIDGVEIGPRAGSCGTAAHEGKPVISENIYEDPQWEEFRDLAAEHDLSACWSLPIVLNTGEVAGTFAMYYREPRTPNSRERGLAEIATYLAQLAIERSRAERRLRELVGDLDAIVWEADASNWEFSYVSPQAEGILGYPPEQWLGDPDFWAQTIHPDDREAAVSHCKQCTKEGRPHEIEYRALTAAGETVWLRDIVNVVTDEAGNPQKLRGVMVDITERKQIEQELREQTETLETINEAGQTLAGELELEELVQAVTDAGTEITGAEFGAFFYNEIDDDAEYYTLYTLSGAPTEAFDDFHQPRNTELFGPTFRGEEIIRLEDVTEDPRFGQNEPYYGMPEGHLPVRSYLAVPVTSSSGEVLGGLFFGHQEPGVFTARDENIITGIAAQVAVAIDNARLYQRARKNEERFRAVTENAVDIIATIDRDTKLQYISPSVENVLGYSPEELSGKPLIDYIHPDDRHQARNEFVALTLVPEDVGSFTLRFNHAEGSTRHLAVKARNMENRPGVEGLLLNIRDVTDLKRYEQELIDAKETAEEMTRVKSNLLANMSHEIRTPLTGILGLAEGLAPKVSGEKREEVQLIEKSGKRLMNTLDSVMALAQLEGEELEISRELVDITNEVQEVIGALEHLAQEKELFLEIQSEAPEAKARADRTLLGRILNNLISNAIKFTREGGVSVTVSATDTEVAISVADTGVGISEDFKPRIFEEFTQESTGLARSHEGIGLGLVLTKKMIDLLEGSISVTSEKDEGSTFTVTLPRASSEPEIPEAGEEAREESLEDEEEADLQTEKHDGEKITSALLVEDNDVIRRVIVERLGERNGYEIEAFAEAEPALDRAEEKTFDVVLIDISLPTMDGVEALQQLRSTDTYRDHPIIAVTGHALPGDRERFLEEGFSEYMAKPFSARELAEKIESLSAA